MEGVALVMGMLLWTTVAVGVIFAQYYLQLKYQFPEGIVILCGTLTDSVQWKNYFEWKYLTACEQISKELDWDINISHAFTVQSPVDNRVQFQQGQYSEFVCTVEPLYSDTLGPY